MSRRSTPAFAQGGAVDYLDRSIATFDHDPPINDFQRGHLEALKVARAELATLPHPATTRLLKLPSQHLFWYWAREFDSESWHGKRASREQAIADAVADLESDDEGFWLVSGRLRLPSAIIDAELVERVLDGIDDDECWFEDCGIDKDECLRQADDPDGLATVLSAALEHWLVLHCDLNASRMIDDFLTMEFYRKVDLGDGLIGAVLEPETVP